MPDTTSIAPNVPQYLLPRQVAAPDGPVDTRMMYAMHFAFRRDLEMFAAAAVATPYDDRDAWRALAQCWELFSKNLLHHHRGEDAGLWPLLLDHADASERSVLQDMEAEHAQIDPVLERCAAGFEVVQVSPDGVVAERLARDLRAARQCLDGHLRHEETAAMAMVQKYLTTEQWDAMAKQHFGKGQSFRDLLATLPWVAYEMPTAELDGLVKQAGRPFAVLLRLTRGRFERRHALATRYLAPS